MSSANPSTRSAQSGAVTRWASLMLYAALVTIGLMAGMYWDWDVAVMPGLARLDDRTFVAAMQSLIVAIENPGFFLVSFGAFGFTAVAALLQVGAGSDQRLGGSRQRSPSTLSGSSSRWWCTCRSTTPWSMRVIPAGSPTCPLRATISGCRGGPPTWPVR